MNDRKISAMAESSLYPLTAVILSAGFVLYKYILQVYPGIISNDLVTEFELSALELGNLSAYLFYTYTIVQIFSGILIDRFNLRYITTGAIIVASTGMLIFAQADSLILLKFARALMGAGVAFATVNYLKLSALLFTPKSFPILSGLLATAAMSGTMYGTSFLAFMIASSGWRPALTYCALGGYISALIFFLIIRNHSISFPGNASSIQGKLPSFLMIFKKVLANKNNWRLSLYCAFTFAPLSTFISLWGVPFLSTAYNLSRASAARELVFILIGFAIGAPLNGKLSNFFNRGTLMLVNTSVAFLCLTFITFYPMMPGELLRLFLFGFGFGTGAVMLVFDIIRESNPLALTATGIAFANSCESFFSGISEPLIGFILDSYKSEDINDTLNFTIQNYQIAFSMLIVYFLIAILLLILIRQNTNRFGNVSLIV